jgi:hypothetical protein
MATINRFVSFDERSLSVLDGASGAAFNLTIKRTGVVALRLSGAGAYGYIAENSWVSSGGTGKVVGFAYYPPSSPTVNADICVAVDSSGTAAGFTMRHKTNDDVDILDSGGSVIRTITDPFTVAEWNTVEIFWQNLNSGTIESFINGVSQGSDSAQDLLAGTYAGYRLKAAATVTLNFDDVYLMSGATASTDRLGGSTAATHPRCSTYWSTLASATPDVGDALETGDAAPHEWVDMQTVPFSDTSWAGYTNSAARSGVVTTNDAGGAAGTGGPNTDTEVENDPVAVKGFWRLARGGGGATSQHGELGNDTDGTTSSADFDIDTAIADYEMYSEAASVVPTSGEYGRIGISKSSGGQDLECYDMAFTVLHVPSPPAAGFPYHVVKQNRRDRKSIITL